MIDHLLTDDQHVWVWSQLDHGWTVYWVLSTGLGTSSVRDWTRSCSGSCPVSDPPPVSAPGHHWGGHLQTHHHDSPGNLLHTSLKQHHRLILQDNSSAKILQYLQFINNFLICITHLTTLLHCTWPGDSWPELVHHQVLDHEHWTLLTWDWCTATK